MSITTPSARRSSPDLIHLAVFLALSAAVLVLCGCGKEAPKPEEPSSSAPSGGPPSAVAMTDPFDLPVPTAPGQLPVRRTVKEASVTLAGADVLSDVIAKSQVRSLAPDKVTGPSAEALQRSRDSGLVLGDRVVEITPPASYGNGRYLPADLQLTLPLTAEQTAGATPRNVGVVHLTERGPVYVDGYYDADRSAVVVDVPHLSGLISFQRDPMKEITDAIAQEASRRAWGAIGKAREQLEEKLMKSAEEYLEKQAFEKLDGGIKRKILAGLITHREEIGNLFTASGGQDVPGFCRSFQLLMGKIIVDHAPASTLRTVLETVTKSTDTIEAVSQAGGQAAGGDYWAAVEILGKAYSESTPIYQFTVQAAALMEVGWSMLKDDALETFYQEYKAGTYIPERVSTREDILIYLKRKFPKADGSKMTDAEVVAFVDENFARRAAHEKETAEWEADLKKIYEWYTDRPLIRSTIEDRFNKPNRADCFRRFLRILDAIDGHLVRLGIVRSPWGRDGSFMPQPEMVELVNAFTSGGAPAFNRTLMEIQRRLAKPLDLAAYTGYWILADSKRNTLSTRSSSDDTEHRLAAKADRTGPHAYVGSVQLSDAFFKEVPGSNPQRVQYTYEASGTVEFDEPPSVVPNASNWDVNVKVSLKESCSADWADASEAIASRLGSTQIPASEGARPRHVNCSAVIQRAENNRVRVRSRDDLLPSGPTRFSAGADRPWNQPVGVRFPLIPETTVSTAEEFILILEAWTPAGTFREQHTYKWSKELPKSLESDLHRQISRANFQGVRSDKPDMSGAAQARPAEAAAPVQTAAGSKVRMTALRYVPEQLVARQEADFEITVENGPAVPSFAWSFGDSTPGRTDGWTAIPRYKFTYYKPGTFTITVKLRDKNNYTKGDLAVGAWEVTVAPEP